MARYRPIGDWAGTGQSVQRTGQGRGREVSEVNTVDDSDNQETQCAMALIKAQDEGKTLKEACAFAIRQGGCDPFSIFDLLVDSIKNLEDAAGRAEGKLADALNAQQHVKSLLLAEQQSCEEKVEALQGQVWQLQDQLEDERAAAKKANEGLQRKLKYQKEWTQTLAQMLKKKAGERHHDKQCWEEKLQLVQEELAEVQQELAAARQQLHLLQEEQASKLAEVEALQGQMEDVQDQLEDERAAAKKANEGLQRDIADLQQVLKNVKIFARRVDEAYINSLVERDSWRQKYRQLESEKASTVDYSLGAQKELAGAREKLAGARQQLNLLKKASKLAEADMDQLKSSKIPLLQQLSDAAVKLAMQEGQDKRLQDVPQQLQECRVDLPALKRRCSCLRYDKRQLSVGKEQALEALLQCQLQEVNGLNQQQQATVDAAAAAQDALAPINVQPRGSSSSNADGQPASPVTPDMGGSSASSSLSSRQARAQAVEVGQCMVEKVKTGARRRKAGVLLAAAAAATAAAVLVFRRVRR